MTLKKLFVKILLIFLVLAIGFCGLLYLTLRTRVNNASNQEPFASFIGKEILLGQDAILVNNYEHFVHEEPLYLDAIGSQLFEGTTIAYTLSKGDVIVFNAVKDFTNGVSGTTSTILLGEVTTGNPRKTKPFEYDWENQKVAKNSEGIYVFTFEFSDWE